MPEKPENIESAEVGERAEGCVRETEATARIAPVAETDDGRDAGDGAAENEAKRPLRKRLSLVIVSCAVVVLLCALGLAAGHAAGLVSIVPDDMLRTTGEATTAAHDGTETGDTERPASVDREADESDEADGAEGEGVPGEGEADARDASAAEVPPEAPDAASEGSGASGGASASEAAPTPAPEPEPAPAPATITVSVYVDSSRAASFGYASCMASTSVTLQQGASVYDALAATGVSIGGSSTYVSSINGLSEFGCGSSTSGWLYFVNGVSPGYGPGSYRLNGGESITFVYTLDMGNDL